MLARHGTFNARHFSGGSKISALLFISCSSRDDTIFAFSTDDEEGDKTSLKQHWLFFEQWRSLCLEKRLEVLEIKAVQLRNMSLPYRQHSHTYKSFYEVESVLGRAASKILWSKKDDPLKI